MFDKKIKLAFAILLLLCVINVSFANEEKINFYVLHEDDVLKFVAVCNGTNYTWYFGDGSIGYGKEVYHSYSEEGIYNVRLIIKQGEEEIVNETKQISFYDEPPKADFYYTPNSPYTYEIVYFFDNSTDEDGYIINWTWDFGDGSIAYGKFVNHSYEDNGIYNVTLTVVDNSSKADSITKQIIVRNRLPIAKFIWKREGDELKFYDLSYDIDGYIANWTWDFGDGSISYERNPNHSYAEEGKYTITLTITDDDGDQNSTSITIRTYNKMPVVDFVYEPLEPTDLDNITFTSICSDDGRIINYTWYFGDGNISYEENPTHRYEDDGKYIVTLLVIDNEWAFSSTQKEITVKNVPPVANFTWAPRYVVPNKNVTFNASSSYDLDGNIVTYEWKFGDGYIGYGMEINHTYNQHGIYDVTLTVYDDDGASTAITKKLLIADLYVDENIYDPANYTWNKIQDAVDNSSDGYFIYVNKGTYNEDVYIDKQVRILANNASVAGISYSFYLAKDEIEIINFSIYSSAKGIIVNCNSCLIENCSLQNNNIGIELIGDFNKIKNCLINSNNISLIIKGEGNIVTKNSLYGLYSCKLTGNANQIYENIIRGILFGIYLLGDYNTVYKNSIEECQYGIYSLNGNIIRNNTFSYNGYGLKVENYSIIEENEFFGNVIGIYAKNSAIKNCKFIDNEKAIFAINTNIDKINISDGEIGIEIYDGEIKNSLIKSIKGLIINGVVSIENCSIYGCNIGIEGDGIANIELTNFSANIYAVTGLKAFLENCSFYENEYGIKGNDSTVNNSSFFKNEYAILMEKNNSIYSCKFIKNDNAIGIIGEENSLIDCYFIKNGIGIKIEGMRNTIQGNEIANNTYGLIVSFAPYNVIAENKFYNNTYNLDIEGSKLYHFYMEFINNSINNRSIFYAINETDLDIVTSYGYIALINCSNIFIENVSITNNGEALLIVFSDKISIYNSSFSTNIYGIYVLESKEIEIEGVNLINNEQGISSKSSQDILLQRSNIIWNEKGINIFNLEKSISNVTIKDCIIANNTLDINIENIVDAKLDNLSINGYLRIFNSNTFILNSKIKEKIKIELGDLEVINSIISEMEVKNSTLSIKDGKLNSINAIDSELKVINISVENIYLENCNAIIKNSSFIGYGNIINGGYLLLEDCLFKNNTYALNITNSIGIIKNVTFYLNEYSLIVNASLDIVNATVYENENGFIIYSNCKIKNSTYFNNTIALNIKGENNVINRCLFHHNSKAILLEGIFNKVVNCSFWRNFYGIIAYSSNNSIYHNNFINNIENARDYGNNTWYAPYPMGGNYWSDYAGDDIYKGEKQNESGSDGIGDIPYEFYGNKDIYPLMDYCIDAASVPNKPPVAAFSFYPYEPFSKEEIIFMENCYDENGKGDIVNYTWYFGDGTKSYERNPKHSYDKPGEYNVTLIVVDKAGDNDSITIKIIVRNVLPIANFTWEPAEIYSYTSVKFNASLSYDIDGYITNYTWYFGDGSIAYGKLISHKYSKSGEYKVKLIVKDNYGNESYIEKIITVKNREPTASFVFSPSEPYVGEEINFTDLSTDLDGKIIEWRWDFGDGSISFEQNPKHSYKEPGKYNVTLIVKDDEGAKAIYSFIIEVKKKEAPSFEVFLFIIAAIIAIFIRKLKINYRN